jgi:hypothetical protein
MQRAVRLLEAFVPRLGDRPESWYEEIQVGLAASLGDRGHETLVIVMPEDETVLVLAWSVGETGIEPDGAGLAEALVRAVGGAVVQRIVEARLVVSMP